MDYKLPENKLNLDFLQKILESNALLLAVVLILALKIISTGLTINLPSNVFFADITKSALEDMANQTRLSAGLNILSDNAKLDEAAQLKAEDMVKNQYFAHTSPTGVSPWFWFLQAGYNYKFAGENLAIGFFDSQDVFNAWMNSPEHKANLMNPNYKDVGTAVLPGYGGGSTIVVVQLFGAAQPVKNTTAKKPAQTVEAKPIKPAAPLPVVAAQLKQIGGAVSGAYPKATNYVLYNSSELLENIIYGISFVVIGILITLIFFSFDFKFEKKLIIRSALILMILGFSLYVNNNVIFLFISRRISI